MFDVQALQTISQPEALSIASSLSLSAWHGWMETDNYDDMVLIYTRLKDLTFN